MRILTVITAALLFVGVTACNNSGQQNNATSEDTEGTQTQQEDSQASSDENGLPPVPADAKVYFKNLEDGQTVSSPVKVEMGVDDMKVEPSGEVNEGAGHHHILVDEGDSFPKGEVIPDDDTHIHFGGGQTEAELDLPSGDHTLTLQFADGAHRSYGSQLAASVTIHVE